MITASVASVPEREQLLEQVLLAIAPQVDKINICLNGYREPPRYLSRLPVQVEVLQGDNRIGCGEKFRWAAGIEGYHVVLDDDMLYPSDYVERLIAWSQRYADRAVVGVHGFRFRQPPIENYYKARELFHFKSALTVREVCHVLGTGTILYHHRALRFRYEEIGSRNMSDLWFAIAAQRERVPMVAIAREAEWLRSNPLLKELGLPSIFSSSVSAPSAVTELANSVAWNLHEPDSVGFTNCSSYWEQRYLKGADSGAGSRGRLGSYKAEFLNRFVETQGIEQVIEFGCGEGCQLAHFSFPSYSGFDVSATAIDRCRERFAGDPTRCFATMSAYQGERAPLVLSLDVVYHLVDDAEYERYLRSLFAASSRFVIIYSSNAEAPVDPRAPHVRHRAVTDWVQAQIRGWSLIESPPQPYPFKGDYTNESFASFFVFQRDGVSP